MGHVMDRLAVLEAKERGLDGAEGPVGPEGKPGRDGRDGGYGPSGRDGDPGKDGRDGKDALGFDDLSVLYDGERTITHRFMKDDQIKEFAVTLPIVLDRGVWTAGRAYDKGDGVTWGGSFWIAQEATTAKPGESSAASRAWRLAVKSGRDGKEGKAGPVGPDGKQGPAGADGRRAY